MRWLDEIEDRGFPQPVEWIQRNPVYEIVDPEDIRLALYRLTKIRNHQVYSWFNKIMQDRHRRPVLVISKTVVHRAVRGCHEVISIMLTRELLDDMRPIIQERQFVEGIYLVDRLTYEKVIGLAVNSAQACAALIDLQTADCLESTVGAAGSMTSHSGNEPTLHLTGSSDSVTRRQQFLWQPDCVFGVDRRWAARSVTPPMIILDNVRSSDNVGVILRTAFSFGLRSMIVTRDSLAALGCRAARTSMGALSFFSIYVSEDLIETIGELQVRGIEVIATSPRSEEDVSEREHRNWALVVGNEELGSSDEVLNKCSTRVAIPQVSGDSLSVSVASGICLYALMRRNIESRRIGAGDC